MVPGITEPKILPSAPPQKSQVTSSEISLGRKGMVCPENYNEGCVLGWAGCAALDHLGPPGRRLSLLASAVLP